MDKPVQKTLDQKIKECKEIIVQNMEKTLQHKMVYMFFKEQKIDGDMKTFSLNSKDGIIKIQFNDHQKARKFYEQANFKEKILIRPFNIYFNLQLSDAEMKKYFIEGITQQNQRQVFDIARRFGFCKIYTNYAGIGRGKLKSKGVLSIIRKEQLSEQEYKNLQSQLKKIDITSSPYVADKGLKCSIKIINFFTGDTKKEQLQILKQSEAQIRNILKPLVKAQPLSVSTNVKRKDDKEKPDTQKIYVTAIVQYENNDATMDSFETIRDAFVNKGQTKAILNFHNYENNSFFSLYTSGLQKKDEKMSDKQFQDLLLKSFREVNKKVIQVNIFPVHFNKTWIGRVYLRSEQDGKDFIVDYVSKRQSLMKCYKSKDHISFNINVDLKTLRRIKQAERKANDIAKGIKNSEEAQKKSKRTNPAINQMPLNAMMPGNMPFGNIGGPIGVMGGINPMMGMQNKGMPPMMGMQPPMMGIAPVGGMTQEADPKKKLQQLIRDKQKFIKMQVNTAKRLILPSLKYAIEACGVSNPAQNQTWTQKIAKQDINEIFKCLEQQEELKKKLNK